ncbi:MAG: hypothetical protein ACK4K7_06595 [Allosphingosinicella sp.]
MPDREPHAHDASGELRPSRNSKKSLLGCFALVIVVLIVLAIFLGPR